MSQNIMKNEKKRTVEGDMLPLLILVIIEFTIAVTLSESVLQASDLDEFVSTVGRSLSPFIDIVSRHAKEPQKVAVFLSSCLLFLPLKARYLYRAMTIDSRETAFFTGSETMARYGRIRRRITVMLGMAIAILGSSLPFIPMKATDALVIDSLETIGNGTVSMWLWLSVSGSTSVAFAAALLVLLIRFQFVK